MASFKIKKQNMKGFAFLINFVCPTFDIFGGGLSGLKEKLQNDVLCGNEDMDASP